MTTSVLAEPLAAWVWCDDENLWVKLADGRRIGVPLGFYPRLCHATPVERANWRLIADGVGIHWPDIDEDISVDGLLTPGGDNTVLGREHHANCPVCRASAGLTE